MTERREAGRALAGRRVFAEFAVIVLGVLIALAVDSWWERHQERKQAREYLQQLLVDFQATERRLASTIAAEKERLERTNAALSQALSGPAPLPDSLDFPTGYNFFEPLTGTLTALVEGGDLRLLRNDSIRFELLGFAALIQATDAILRHSETLVWNSTERLALGRARHSQSAARRAGNGGRGWGPMNVAAALNDPEIVSALQLQAAATHIRIFNLGRLSEPVARIIKLIEAELS